MQNALLQRFQDEGGEMEESGEGNHQLDYFFKCKKCNFYLFLTKIRTCILF